MDERLNIRAATMAAAQILRENYEKLGTWPLAITAYNHGANGMKQAVATVGTTDFGDHCSALSWPAVWFRLAEFLRGILAALELSQNYKQYFGDLLFAEPSRPVTIEARTVGEPSTFSAFVEPSRPVTPGSPYGGRVEPGDCFSVAVRGSSAGESGGSAPESRCGINANARSGHVRYQWLPSSGGPEPSRGVVPSAGGATSSPCRATYPGASAPSRAVISRVCCSAPASGGGRTLARVSLPVVSPPAPTLPPARDKVYRVRPGDTLFTIAQRHETTVATLASMNGLSQRAGVKAGQTLRLPAAPQPVVSAEKTLQKGVMVPVVTPVKSAAALPVHRTVLTEITTVPASAQAEDRFQVKGDTIRVAAQEQLSQYAEWLDVPVQRLLTLNRLSQRQTSRAGACAPPGFFQGLGGAVYATASAIPSQSGRSLPASATGLAKW